MQTIYLVSNQELLKDVIILQLCKYLEIYLVCRTIFRQRYIIDLKTITIEHTGGHPGIAASFFAK